MTEGYKTLILDGFSREEALAVLRAVKSSVPNPREIIFAMTTDQSKNLVLKDLLADLREEHEYFLKNPPPNSPAT